MAFARRAFVGRDMQARVTRRELLGKGLLAAYSLEEVVGSSPVGEHHFGLVCINLMEACPVELLPMGWGHIGS